MSTLTNALLDKEPAARPGEPAPIDWRKLLGGLALFKVGYLALATVALWLWPSMDVQKFHSVMMQWPRQGEPIFASHFATWDAAHYLLLSEVGYGRGVPSCAFYPLWPLMMRWFSVFTGGSHVVSGMILANVFSLAGWFLFYQTASRRFGQKVALFALAFLILFPGSIFYQFIYTEPLFFFLAMLLWYGMERQKYSLVWISAFLLPVTRGVGIFCVLPLAWHLAAYKPLPHFQWLQKLTSNNPTENAEPAPVPSARNIPYYGLLMIPLLGWLLYFTLMTIWTGNPFEGIQAQRHWGNVHSIGNLFNVPKFLVGLVNFQTIHEFQGSLFDRLMFVWLVMWIPDIWRLGKDMMVWTYVLGILPAMSGTFVSFTRFESIAFPMFLALAVACAQPDSRSRRIRLFTFCVFFHVLLLWQFLNFGWAG